MKTNVISKKETWSVFLEARGDKETERRQHQASVLKAKWKQKFIIQMRMQEKASF